MSDTQEFAENAQVAGEAIRRDRTLHDLVAQFRRRAEIAEIARNGHKGEGREKDAERLEGKRQAYQNCADDLARVLREDS